MSRVSVIVVTLLALPHAAHAEPAAVLWSSDLPSADAAPLRAAIESSSGATLFDFGNARRRLDELARALREDPGSSAHEEALRAARDAYVSLRLEDARRHHGRALQALLERSQPAPTAAEAARIAFERGLVALAAQKRTDARADLLAALAIDPNLAPDPDVYGPPVFRALAEARAVLARAPTARLHIDRAPADAVVRVDGAVVPAGEPVVVRATVAHLVVAERPGHAPRAQWVEPPGRAGARLAIVLPEATGALLAQQALDAWPAGTRPTAEAAVLVARALGAAHVVEAARDPDGTLRLVLRDARTRELIRSAEGGRVPWEPRPFFVLAEALEGRVVEPPARAATVSLAASLPTAVAPGDGFALQLTMRDPDTRVRTLEARCGPAVGRLRIPPTASGSFSLPLSAPNRTGAVRCSMRGLDAAGRAVVSLPAPGESLSLQIAEVERAASVLGRWWFWGVVGVAAAAGVGAAILATRPDPEPRQVLVLHAP